jgi:hypothetical protein
MAPTGLVAALLLVGVWFGDRTDDPLEAANGPNVVQAEAYLLARNNRDAPVALALLAEGATVAEYPLIRVVGDLPAAFAYLDFVDETLDVGTCEPAQLDGAEVICDYRLANRLTRAAESEPVSGTMRFVFEDGQIVDLTNLVDFDRYWLSFDPFYDYVDIRRPNGAAEGFRRGLIEGEVVRSPRLDRLELLESELVFFEAIGP